MPVKGRKQQQASGARLNLAQAVRRCYQGRLRQEDLAQALGVHQSKVSKWATGTMRPTVDDISAMEDACGRARGYVLSLTGHVTAAGVAEGNKDRADAVQHADFALAADRGGRADLTDVVRRSSKPRPRSGATPTARDST